MIDASRRYIFPLEERKIDIYLFRPGRPISDDDAVEKMKDVGLKPTGKREVQNLKAEYAGRLGNFPIIALGDNGIISRLRRNRIRGPECHFAGVINN